MPRIRAIAVIVAFVATIAAVGPAHAQIKGGPSDKSNVDMTLDLQYGLVHTSTQLFTTKGPMDCGAMCGKIIARYDGHGVFASASVKLKAYERRTSASYMYTSFDGSGDYDGQAHWNAKGVLPATKPHTDAQGTEHKLYLTSMSVWVYNKRPTVKRVGLTGSAAPRH
jgi:hypothetical protein